MIAWKLIILTYLIIRDYIVTLYTYIHTYIYREREKERKPTEHMIFQLNYFIGY